MEGKNIQKMKLLIVLTALFTFKTYSFETDQNHSFQTPESTVEAFEEVTINLLKSSDSLTVDERYYHTLRRIEHIIDFKTMARLILGDQLNEEGEDLKNQFIHELMKLSARAMALNYKNYNNQKYTTTKIKKNHSKAVVYTDFLASDRETVPFKFMLKRNDKGNWQIINIVAGGVSELSLKRIEYKDFLKNKRLQDLINVLKRKNEFK